MVSEIAICVYLTMTMRHSYGGGEGTFLLSVVPVVAMLFYSYHLQRFAGQWALGAASRLQYRTALAWQIAGVMCGFGGLWLAIVGGPHGAPFFVLWGLLLQLGAIWVARRKLMP